jgi:hypothetical protein
VALMRIKPLCVNFRIAHETATAYCQGVVRYSTANVASTITNSQIVPHIVAIGDLGKGPNRRRPANLPVSMTH